MRHPSPNWTEDDLQRVREELEAVPLHRFYGIEVDSMAASQGTARVTVSENTANVHGFLHGGVYYAVLDVVAYLGVVPLLDFGENAVTHDIHVSVMRPARIGDVLELTGKVRRRGRTLIFCEAEAHIDGKLSAMARVTKSILSDGSFPWRKK